MDKITINELCHFLPHKLMGKYQLSHVIKVPKHSDEIREKMLLPDSFQFFLNYYKPIVYPLSMLTQEIEHNGEVIVPILELAKISFGAKGKLRKSGSVLVSGYVFEFDGDDFSAHENIPFGSANTVVNQLQLFQKLFSMHIDVFNWIGRGLAIDKSTLNEK